MQTEYKYLRFVLSSWKTKTAVFDVVTHDSDTTGCVIGKIMWFNRWRRYAFYPDVNTVYEPQCLTDIASFLKDIRMLRKDNYEEPMR